MKPWENDAFSIMQGLFFFFKPSILPHTQGWDLKHSLRGKSYFTSFNGYFFKLEKFHVTFKHIIKRGRARSDSNFLFSQPNLLQLKNTRVREGADM